MKKRVVISIPATLALFLFWVGMAWGASAGNPWGAMSEIEAAARKEGKLVVYRAPGHINPEAEQAITQYPNAAKLFFHWLYTKEGQAIYAPKSLAISVRKDVPQEYLPPDQRYVEGQPLLMTDVEDLTPERSQELVVLGRQIFEQRK